MIEIQQPRDGEFNQYAGTELEQVEMLRAQSREGRRAAIDASSVALGALINQLAQQEAGVSERYVSKRELVAQVTDILGDLGLDKMARAVAISMRRVGGMY